MATILIKLLRPLAPYAALALVLAGLGGYGVYLRHRLAAEMLANAALEQTNQANVAAMAAWQAQNQRWDSALNAMDTQTEVSHQQAAAIISSIDQATPNADAPIAPVLARALADVQALQAGAK